MVLVWLCLVDILELKDRIMLLYDSAQLDGDNSELDALKRLASSHDNNAASLSNAEETLPALPSSTQCCTSKLSRENTQRDTVVTTAVSTAAECKVQVAQSPAEHPAFADRSKPLVIPSSLSLTMKQHSVTGQNRSGVTQCDAHGEQKTDQPGSEYSVLGQTKRKCMSDSTPKSVPLGDVMNVKLPRSDRKSLVSLVPLSSVVSAASTGYSPVKSEWNQHVKIKLEPGTSGQRKRKLPVEPGMF